MRKFFTAVATAAFAFIGYQSVETIAPNSLPVLVSSAHATTCTLPYTFQDYTPGGPPQPILSGQLNTDLQSLNGCSNDIYGQIGTINSHLSTIDGHLTTIDGHLSTIDGEITTLNGEVTTLNGDVTTLDGDVTSLQSQINAIHAVAGPSSSTDHGLVLFNGTTGQVLKDVSLPIIVVTDPTYGAKCDGSTNDQSAIQTAINAAASAGGGHIIIPDNKTCKVNGTLTIDANFVTVGPTPGGIATLLFANTSGDDFDIGASFPAAQVRNVKIHDLYINHTGKTGGYIGNITNCFTCGFENITSDNAWEAFNFQGPNNSDFVHHVNLNVLATSGAAILYFSSPDNNHRSDYLDLQDVTIQALFHGTDCFVWDGPSNDVVATHLTLLGCHIAMHIQNSAASGSFYPGFGHFWDLETDGESLSSVVIDAGEDYHFISPDISNTSGAGGQGNADTDAFICNPDTGHSFTRNIWISGGRIHNSLHAAANFNCLNVYVSGTTFDDASKAGVGSFPTVQVGANSSNINFSGGSMGSVFGDTNRASVPLGISTGANIINVVGVDMYGNQGDYSNSSTGQVYVLGGTDQTGAPRTTQIIKNAGGGSTWTFSNPSTAGGTTAAVSTTTGTTNAFTALANTDGGSPGGSLSTGAGDSNGLSISTGAGPIALSPAGTVTSTKTIAISQAPANAVGVDFSSAVINVPNGLGGSQLAVGAGLLFVTDQTGTGQSGIYSLGNGVGFVGASGAVWNNSGCAPAAGHASVCVGGGGNYFVINNTGIGINVGVGFLRTRAAN